VRQILLMTLFLAISISATADDNEGRAEKVPAAEKKAVTTATKRLIKSHFIPPSVTSRMNKKGFREAFVKNIHRIRKTRGSRASMEKPSNKKKGPMASRPKRKARIKTKTKKRAK
jgi:hypothetical protein